MNSTRSIASFCQVGAAPRSLDGRGLQNQTVAALALACAIPVLLIGYLTVQYVLPHANSVREVYATIGFSMILAVLGTFLSLPIFPQVQTMTHPPRAATAG